MWYKIEADFGPGHQSHAEYYEWYPRSLTQVQMKIVFEDTFRGREWPIGYVTRIVKLPENVRLAKIGQYERELKNATKMLRILNGGQHV